MRHVFGHRILLAKQNRSNLFKEISPKDFPITRYWTIRPDYPVSAY